MIIKLITISITITMAELHLCEDIHMATYHQHPNCIRTFLDQEENNGSTALHMASFNGDIESISLLLNHGADMDIQNMDGETLDWAEDDNSRAFMNDYFEPIKEPVSV
jgi:hypothetical protein